MHCAGFQIRISIGIEWKNMALRIFAGLGDVLGKPLFYEWSQKCPEYDPRTGPAADHECWEQVRERRPIAPASKRFSRSRASMVGPASCASCRHLPTVVIILSTAS